jgi:hypothetical protein
MFCPANPTEFSPGLAITTRSDATVGGNPIRKAGMEAMAIHGPLRKMFIDVLPSGKRLHNYGKIHHF